MIITKSISFLNLVKWTFHHIVWLLILTSGIAALYHFEIISVRLPWLPVSVVGTAVAFYVGFKNNQAYDRMWEARKIWGGIINESRSWGMMSLCRTIEIDLREMLYETDLPPSVKAKDGVLM